MAVMHCYIYQDYVLLHGATLDLLLSYIILICTFAVLCNPHSKVKADEGAKPSGEEVVLPPLPPKLYENVFDDQAILEHHKHDTSKGSEENELPPPLPPKLYENIFDDPIITEHHADTATNCEREELAPPPLPPKMYVNVFDDATQMDRANDVMELQVSLTWREEFLKQMEQTSHDLKAHLQG